MTGAFGLQELREIMRSVAGVEAGVDLDGPIADQPFDELGYDSLAVLEVMSEVQRRRGVELPSDEVFELETPAQAIEFVNRLAVGV